MPSIVVFLIACGCLHAQSSSTLHVETFPVPENQSSFTVHLSKNFIIASTIKVGIDSLSWNNFSFSSSSNSLTLQLDTILNEQRKIILVTYHYLPFTLKPSYSLRTLVFKSDSAEQKKKRAVVTQSEGVFSNIFGPELSKSGSISRGFLVGSNRDLTLSSGFRLQMAGKISNDIDIIAALTDENTPIQPQGNTQTLQEVDNIFVEIKSLTYTATLGDFQFSSAMGEFVRVNRKLQGAKILADYQSFTPQTQVQFTGATSRGKYHSNQFPGIEGAQGPYRLTGKNNERNIIIIAGSEKVYVNGDEMTRGDNNDYSIDYGSAEVTFSTKRLITSASRIVVDFEYSDRQFTRNFAGVGVASVLSNSISVRANYFREGDDPDAPIDISLSDADKTVLEQAGNSLATKSGVIVVGTDSLGIGKGNYIAVDTLIDGNSFRFYRFESSTPQSIYNVAFSNVGQGNGEYIRVGIGNYKFVGKQRGQYSPIVILPSPQLHQLYSAQTTITPIKELTIDGEYAASNFDRNRFATIGDNGNIGGAFKFNVQYSPKNVSIGSANIGAFDIIFYERYKEKNFFTLDRTDIVEFGRKWSNDSLLTNMRATEEIREGKFVYMPSEGISVGTGIGTLERTNQFSSQRYDGTVEIKKDDLPTVSYLVEQISGKENTSLIKNDWFRHKGNAEYTFSCFTPGFRFEEEKREVKLQTTDSLTPASFSFSLYAPKLGLSNFFGFDAVTEFEWRNDDATDIGELIPQSESFTQTYSVSVREIKNFSASSSITLREKKYEKAFQSVNTNQQTKLIKTQSRYRPFSQGLDIDLFYDAATQRTAKLERVFYKVRKGEGQYIWNDANGNGIVDLNNEREFIPDRYDGEYIAITLNSDNLIPIINLKTSARIRMMPARFIREPSSVAEKILTTISTETYLRLEERSSEPNTERIYLLDFNHFLNPATTLMGFQFIQQDLFLFENNPEYSFRFRFNQRKGLSQFSSGTENNYSRERSLRTRFQISNEVSNQTDVIFKEDNALSSSVINRSRQIFNSAVISDFSYRPEQNLEVGMKIETSQADDLFPAQPVTASFNGQTIRTVIAFQGNGQVRVEFSREEVLLQNQSPTYSAPFELTSGRDLGKNYLWSAASEYKIGGNVQFSLQYNGRTTSRSNVVHTGRMEVRAFF